jgi:hypothetical protein
MRKELVIMLPPDNDPNHSFDPMEMVLFLEELEAEQMKLFRHIANNEQRIAALEATLEQLQSLPGYQPQFSLVENLNMALGTLRESIEMARSVFTAERLSDAHASAACYLASQGISSDDSPVDATDNRVENRHD